MLLPVKPPSLPGRLINRLSSHFPAKDERFLQVPEVSRVGLDPHQRAAAFAPSSRTIIQAGAGSGKTAVLTRRVAHLLQSGVPLNRIRIITFTRHATRELVERLHKLTGGKSRIVCSWFGGGAGEEGSLEASFSDVWV